MLQTYEDSSGYIASLYTESLFTNVLVQEATKIPPKILKELLLLCTTGTIFKDPRNIYPIINGASIGSLLGPVFTNFYMWNLDKILFEKTGIKKTLIYCRYVDDIFMLAKDKR